jgi:hypothetical protein
VLRGWPLLRPRTVMSTSGPIGTPTARRRRAMGLKNGTHHGTRLLPRRSDPSAIVSTPSVRLRGERTRSRARLRRSLDWRKPGESCGREDSNLRGLVPHQTVGLAGTPCE